MKSRFISRESSLNEFADLESNFNASAATSSKLSTKTSGNMLGSDTKCDSVSSISSDPSNAD